MLHSNDKYLLRSYFIDKLQCFKLCIGADGSISVWDIKALTVSDSVDEPGNQIGALDLSNDGLCFATAGKVSLAC